MNLLKKPENLKLDRNVISNRKYLWKEK